MMAHIFEEESMRKLMVSTGDPNSGEQPGFDVILKAPASVRSDFRALVLKEALARIKKETAAGRKGNAQVYEGMSYEIIALERELAQAIEDRDRAIEDRENLELEFSLLEIELEKRKEWDY